MGLGKSLKKAFKAATSPVANVLTGGLASGLLPMVGGAYMDYKGAEEAREADIASAREQMQFQERMSSTAHQREVTDLKAAGLNPVLSANSGASTPVGQNIDAENMLSPAISTALTALRLKKDIQEADSRIALNQSQKKYVDTDTRSEEPYAEIGTILRDWIREGGGTLKGLTQDFHSAKDMRKKRGEYMSREEYWDATHGKKLRLNAKPNTFYSR